ncbi:MAG: hypothetical protein ACKOWF_04025 [Chloroflexota bacterium]
MNGDEARETDSAESRAQDFPDAPVSAADVASAGRSCSMILVLLAVILLLLCVSIGLRWYGIP